MDPFSPLTPEGLRGEATTQKTHIRSAVSNAVILVQHKTRQLLIDYHKQQFFRHKMLSITIFEAFSR